MTYFLERIDWLLASTWGPFCVIFFVLWLASLCAFLWAVYVGPRERKASAFKVQYPMKKRIAAKEFERAFLALRQGKWQQARKIFAALEQVDPEDAELCLGLAIMDYEEGRYEAADAKYKELKERDAACAQRFCEHISS